MNFKLILLYFTINLNYILTNKNGLRLFLLNDLIYKIKEAFNKEFESVHQRKLQELAKIRGEKYAYQTNQFGF